MQSCSVILIMLIQFVVGVSLIVRSALLMCMGRNVFFYCCRRRSRNIAFNSLRKPTETGEGSPDTDSCTAEDSISLASYLGEQPRKVSNVGVDVKCYQMSAVEERQRHANWQEARWKSYQLDGSIFCGHVRSEENFIRGNDDPLLVLPPSSPMEVEPQYHSRLMLYSYIFTPAIHNVIFLSLGWALIAGGFGTAIVWTHETDDVSNNDDVQSWLLDLTDHLKSSSGDYKWLPLFMLGGHITFHLQRWRQFALAAWTVEGRLKDIGVIIGSDAKDPQSPLLRKLMFKLYRFMVVAMALQYKAVLPGLRDSGVGACERLRRLGLLTSDEIRVLEPSGSRMRDTVISWIAREINSNSRGDGALLYGCNTYVAMDKISALRANMMYFHGNYFYPLPNIWSAVMTMMVDIWCLIIVGTYPVQLFAYRIGDHVLALQPLTIVSVFLMIASLQAVNGLAHAFSAPFAGNNDTINIDALIAGTEQTLFASLRSSFDDVSRRAGVDLRRLACLG